MQRSTENFLVRSTQCKLIPSEYNGNRLILGQDSDQVLILGSEPRELTAQILHEDKMVHALDIEPKQMHSEGLNCGQEESVMEVANLSGQVLFVGEVHLSSIEEEILLESDISSTTLKKICFKREPNVGQEITVTGENNLDHKMVQFELHEDGASEGITPEMASVQTVTISSNPPSIGESIHKVSRTNTDGMVDT